MRFYLAFKIPDRTAKSMFSAIERLCRLIQEKRIKEFLGLIYDNIDSVNASFSRVFRTFLRYKTYISNAMTYTYSKAKLEATNKLIKDIKRQAFGFRNFKNFKTKILITQNIQKERTTFVLSPT